MGLDLSQHGEEGYHAETVVLTHMRGAVDCFLRKRRQHPTLSGTMTKLRGAI